MILDNKPITENQKRYIDTIMEFSLYPVPAFKGKTRKEAAEYINKYQDCLDNEWSVEHGL